MTDMILFLDEHRELDLIFSGDWSSYEEGAFIRVFQNKDKYFYVEGGDCPVAGYHFNDFTIEDLIEISQDEAVGIMMEWAENEDTEAYLYNLYRV